MVNITMLLGVRKYEQLQISKHERSHWPPTWLCFPQAFKTSSVKSLSFQKFEIMTFHIDI